VKTNSPLAKAIRFAIGGAVGLSATLTVPIASAQDPLDEVVITGSRIRQNPLEQRQPVLSVSAEDYAVSGATSLADFLQRLPISGSAINRTNNASGNLGFPSDGGGIGAGASEIDLRYLASKRILVLVDGRRWIKGSSGSGVSGAVDLNSIPANAVKSIEILQDGASAIYGSDAIGGVVNIITSDDYDSFKISGYTGQYGDGDGETAEFDVRMGARGERTRGMLDISYTDQKEVNTADRRESEFPVFGSTLGASSGIPAARLLFFDDRFVVLDDDGNPIPRDIVVNSGVTGTPVYDPFIDPTAERTDDFHNFGLDDLFNYQPFNHLVTPNERINVFAKGEYDVTDNVMFRALASFNNRQSQGRAAPVPLFFGVEGGLGFYMDNYLWPADHDFNIFGIDLEGNTNGIFLTKRPIEAGPRIFDQDVDTWYLSGGFDGEFTVGDRDLYWDVTAIWSENNARQTQLNQFNARALNTALGDPDVCNATPGCVPLNIIGEGSLTPEMLDYVTYTAVDTSQQTLTDVSANLSGDLFDLPAGALAFAVGYEHREEEGTFVPNPIAAAGESADQPASPTSGGVTFDEFYGEVVVPIVADAPGFDSLSLSAAARYSDSDAFDSETGTKFSVNWAPVDNLMIRASYAEGFRAPNIGELFNLGTRFDTAIEDACDSTNVPVPANCAQLVPPGYVQLNPQISVTTGGNQNLEPETSETWTTGFTWDTGLSAGIVEQLLVEINYYDISIDGAIQAPNAQETLNACIATLDPFFCDAIIRTANGTISRIDGILDNISGVETTGLDINLDLGLGETGLGAFRFQLMASLLFDYDELIPNEAGTLDRFERAGTELGNPSRGFIEEKLTLNNFWSLGDWDAVLSFRYLSSLIEQCAGTISNLGLRNELCNGPFEDVNGVPTRTTNKLDSVVYTDAQVSWSPQELFGGGWAFAVGVNNLFDERPPPCYSCDLNTLSGTIHSIGGTFWYLRASFEK